MVKRSGSEGPAPAAKRARGQLNAAPRLPHERLDVFVFGSGTICELGLGPNVTEVKRPRLSPLLPADSAGIVSVACGGAHTIALDYTGQLWSWGQNDSGALGRDTTQRPEDVDEDNDINPLESTPAKVDFALSDGDEFVAISATDSASAAVTAAGYVYAWGTFIDDGNKAFDETTKFQPRPVRVRGVSRAVALAAGKDHFLALTADGHVYAWGIGSSFQLGYKVRASLRSQRVRTQRPVRVAVRDIVHIAAGDYNSYAIDASGHVFAWGLNNFGQSGIDDPVGPNTFIERPTHAPFWDDKHIVQIAGGGHHSLWLGADGAVYTVGETNFHQLGIPDGQYPENTVREQDGTPSFVPTPTRLTAARFEDDDVALPPIKFIAVGTDHCLALSRLDGSCWTWGFGAVYQIGHGPEEEEEEIPRRIKNTATTGRNMVWAGAGGQFSVIASVHE